MERWRSFLSGQFDSSIWNTVLRWLDRKFGRRKTTIILYAIGFAVAFGGLFYVAYNIWGRMGILASMLGLFVILGLFRLEKRNKHRY
jgi:hypothetical protein